MNRVFRVVLLAALALLGACSDDAAPGGATIEMVEGQRFTPAELRVSVGTTVTFVNDSAEAHTVTAYDDGIPEGADYFASGGFESEDEARDDLAGALVGQDATYAVTFGATGTYEFFCIPHEGRGMRGTIVVGE